MKKKNLNFLLALIAALALVFAFAGCDTSVDSTSGGIDETRACCETEECTGDENCTVCGDCSCTDCSETQAVQKTTIDLSYIESFLQGIGGTIATINSDQSYWTFADGTLDSAGGTVTFTLKGSGTVAESATVSASAVITSLKSLGTSSVVTSTDGLEVTLVFTKALVTNDGWAT